LVLNNAQVEAIKEQLKERLAQSVKVIEDAGKNLDRLRELAAQIQSLDNQVEEAKIRVIRIVRMLGDKETKARLLKNPALRADRKELEEASKYSRSKAVSVRSFMEEYLQIVGEAKVGDIVSFLQGIGIEYAKRQTVESTLRNHPDEFKVTKRKREKFISLFPDLFD
jgi:hypothetical protein